MTHPAQPHGLIREHTNMRLDAVWGGGAKHINIHIICHIAMHADSLPRIQQDNQHALGGSGQLLKFQSVG